MKEDWREPPNEQNQITSREPGSDYQVAHSPKQIEKKGSSSTVSLANSSTGQKNRRKRSARNNQQVNSHNSFSNCSQFNYRLLDKQATLQRINSPEPFRELFQITYKKQLNIEKLVQKSPNKDLIISFAKISAARRIQKFFRLFLLWKRVKQRSLEFKAIKRERKLKEILAGKVIVRNVKKWLRRLRGRRERLQILSGYLKIQKVFRGYMVRKRLKILRKNLVALVKGWQVRKCIKILEDKIQDFVNEENKYRKCQIKLQFNLLYKKIFDGKLFLVSRYKSYVHSRQQSLNQDLTFEIPKNQKKVTNMVKQDSKIKFNFHQKIKPKKASVFLQKKQKIKMPSEFKNDAIIKILNQQKHNFKPQIMTPERKQRKGQTPKPIKNSESKKQLSNSCKKHNKSEERLNQSFAKRSSINAEPKKPKLHYDSQKSSRNVSASVKRSVKTIRHKKSQSQNFQNIPPSNFQVHQLLESQENFKQACQEMQNMMDKVIEELVNQNESISVNTFHKQIGERAKLMVKFKVNYLYQD